MTKARDYVQENLEEEFLYQHLIDEKNFSMEFHCHDHIEIYLSISGGEHFIIDDKIYDMEPRDMFVTNQLEVHRVMAREKTKYERYVLSFKHAFLLPYCTGQTDLLHYIYRRPKDFSNKIHLTKEQFDEFLELAGRYEHLAGGEYANDVLRKLVFVELLALTARYYRQPEKTAEAKKQVAETGKRDERESGESLDMISQLLEYIGNHITEELYLDRLASEIGVSKFHLCKVFKAKTGTTINKYIVTRRVAEAKYLLAKGVPVTEACYQSGFHDLSHFIRTFGNVVGVSPGKYIAEKGSSEKSCYVGPELKAESEKS